MAHEVESMFYVGETPWHGLGVELKTPPTAKEAIIAAGLDWAVEKRPLFACDKEKDGSPVIEVPTHEAIVRTTDDRVLGVVGGSYVPVQNVEAFEFMDTLVTEGKMSYHVAGSLRQGQRIWILGKIGRTDIVKNDPIDKYLLLYNCHDGSGALRALETVIRVVCANTARAALEGGKGEGFYFRHTTNVKNRIEQARKALGLAQMEFDKFVDFAKATAKLKMKAKDIEKFTNTLIPDNPELESNTRAENKRTELLELIETGTGQDIPGVRGTGWAAYGGVVEYVNFKRSTRGAEDERQAARFESSLFGSGNNLVGAAIADLQTRIKAA